MATRLAPHPLAELGRMRKLLVILGSIVGGYIGWAIGALVGTMTAYMVSVVFSGLGMYAGARAASRYLE